MPSERVTIPARFCGPPASANGGYTAGLLAGLIDGPAEVTLRAPPPLETALDLTRSDNGGAVLRQGARLIAEATPRLLELKLPEPVRFEAAEIASRSYPGAQPHPYPNCFVCGPARPRPDGLGIWAGPVAGRRIVASPWLPTEDLCRHGVVEARFVWAALDCPSWFGFAAFAEEALPAILLGRMTASLRRLPHLDQRCVVLGWSTGREGRRIECGSMLLDDAGECLAQARSTWVVLKSPLT